MIECVTNDSRCCRNALAGRSGQLNCCLLFYVEWILELLLVSMLFYKPYIIPEGTR